MKRTLLFLLLSFFTLVTFANSPVNFGLNFRLNMPRASFEATDWSNVFSGISSGQSLDDVVDNSDIGYAGGIFLRFNGKGKGFLHTEAMFSFNSSGFTALDGAETINYTTESTTFNVPVYFGRNVINSRVFKLRAFTGPQFAWIMDASVTGSRNGNDIEDLDSDFEFDKFTWLWSVGAGFELFMFSVDARYGFDIKGIEGANSLEQSFKQKTNMFEFTLGFKLF